MSADTIISTLKKKDFKPYYWLEGEEAFFIDEVMNYAEHHILPEAEASFNLHVFYGKDADWATVLNTCRKYPMFADRQVVLLKEAQQMRDNDLEKFESYFENPLSTTVFFASYKDKKLDARKKIVKTIKAKGELLSTKKLYDNQVPGWVEIFLKTKGLHTTQKAIAMLVDNIGNDLSRIKTEIEKLEVNLAGKKAITEDDIEKYIGVSKEYNVFELQNAFATKNFVKAFKIIQYFEKNPKAAPIQLVLPSLYSFFSKVYVIFGLNTNNEKEIATQAGINPYFVKDYTNAANTYKYAGIEKILLLLHHYNLKSIGINNTQNSDADLMKEFLVKAMN